MKKNNTTLLVLATLGAFAMSNAAFAATPKGEAEFDALFSKDADTVKRIRDLGKSGKVEAEIVRVAQELSARVSIKEAEVLKAQDIETALKSYDAKDKAGFLARLARASEIAHEHNKSEEGAGEKGTRLSLDEAWSKSLNEVEVQYEGVKMKLLEAWKKCMKRTMSF